jgi:hypothetical protein
VHAHDTGSLFSADYFSVAVRVSWRNALALPVNRFTSRRPKDIS